MNAAQIRAKYEPGLGMLPTHMREGVKTFIEDGRRPGSFLWSMLVHGPASDEPWLRADSINQRHHDTWADFMCMYMPEVCHGNELKVGAWCKMGGLKGMAP